MTSNDNDMPMQGATRGLPEPHGRAALLLVESLIHGLCENETLTAHEAVAITERAVDVQGEQAEEAEGAGAPLWRSRALLSGIAASLRIDSAAAPAASGSPA